MSFTTATKGMARGLVLFLVSAALIGGIVLVGWQVGWWFKEENTNRQDKVYDHSYGRQTALKDQVTKNIQLVLTISTQIQQAGADTGLVESLTAQRVATVRMVCSDAAKINPSNPLQGDQAAFVDEHCLAGSVDPSSSYTR